MIEEWNNENRSKLISLFDSFKVGRRIIFPALAQNRGNIWVNSIDSPKVARLQLWIINALAGESTRPEAVEIIKMIEPHEIVFFPNPGWSDIIHEVWGDRIGIQNRTMLSPDSLNVDHLKGLVDNLPEEFTLERIDIQTVRRLGKNMFMHIALFFGSSEVFIEKGIGFCIKHNGNVVSMASTFTPFVDEFEIEVRTSNDGEYRRKGLATVVSAALIIHALEQGFVPHWDAANEISVKLALKLGYTNPYPWQAFYRKKSEDP